MSGKKTKKRINVIDVIIILLALALIATIVFNIYNKLSDNPSDMHGKYVMTFECDDEYNSLVKHLKTGDAVYFYETGTLIGYINAVPYYTLHSNDGGQSEYGKAHITDGSIRLASSATKAHNGDYYTIEDVIISNGSKIKVYTEKAVFTLTVKDITKG